MEIVNAIILSVLFAACMKVAHEIGDERLKFFKGSGILFGLLWGGFAANLILFDNTLANIWMAALAGWILRSKITHFNIALGATMMFLTYLFGNEHLLFDRNVFLLFFGVMAASGLIHDMLYKYEVLDRKKSELMHSLIFFTFLPFFYSFYFENWLIFASLFSFMLAYEITRKLTGVFEEKTGTINMKRS